MKKVFNKSAAYGLVFAISSCWLYYLFFLLFVLEILFPSFKDVHILPYIGNVAFLGLPIHFAVVSIPAYFLMRRRAEHKTVFTAFSMFLSIILQIPLYILTELLVVNQGGFMGDWGAALLRLFILGFLLIVIIAAFILCTADIIISMVKQRVFSIPRILVILTSGILIAGIILIIDKIDPGVILP